MTPTPSETAMDTLSMERLDAFLRKHREKLLAFIASKLPKNMQRAVAPEDVFQEVCIRTRNSWSGFRGTHERVLRAWVYRITDRAVLDELRKSRLPVRGESGIIPPPGQRASSLDNFIDGIAGNGETPSQVLSAREMRAEVQLAISELAQEHVDEAKVVYMRKIQELTQTEIAEQLGKTKVIVNNLFYSGKNRLRKILRKRMDREWGSSEVGF